MYMYIYNVKCTCKFTPPKTDHIHVPLYHLGSSTVLEYLYLHVLAGMGQVHRKVFKYKYKYIWRFLQVQVHRKYMCHDIVVLKYKYTVHVPSDVLKYKYMHMFL